MIGFNSPKKNKKKKGNLTLMEIVFYHEKRRCGLLVGHIQFSNISPKLQFFACDFLVRLNLCI